MYIFNLWQLRQGVDSLAQWLEHWIFYPGGPGSNPTIGMKLFQLCFIPLLWLSCHKNGNLTIGNKILWKRGDIAPQEQFLLFSTIFSLLYLTSGFKLHIHLLNVVVRFIVFFNSENLICRGTDISKYFRESLGLRYNESRLYLDLAPKFT